MKMRRPNTVINHYFIARYSILLILLSSTYSSSHAAYCSLRDPVSAIYTLYPEADQHRSIVRTISQDTRDLIGKRLPFNLHFNEIGRHTLYVAQHQNLPLGFIHARSELSRWGMVEIAWSINTELEIDGFFFQRCRNSACNEILQQKLTTELKGKGLDEILNLLTKNGNALAPNIAAKYQLNHDLVLSVFRSALKTIAATEYAWNDDIKQIRQRKLAMLSLCSNCLPTFIPVLSAELEAIYIPANIAPLYTFVEKPSIQVFRVMIDGIEAARLVNADWRLGNKSGEFSWLFSDEGKVLAINTYGPMPDKKTSVAFKELLGKDVGLTENCATPVEIAGNTLFLNAYKQIKTANP